MSDDKLPPQKLPDPVRVQDVRLMWVPFGLAPLTSFKGLEAEPPPTTLGAAVDAALESYENQYRAGLLPWIRAGTGAGAAVLNVQAILLVKAALETAAKGQAAGAKP